MHENLLLLGFAVIFIGIVIIVIASLMGAKESGTKINVGVGGFIGPVPFGWATSKEMLYLVIAITIALFAVFMLWGLAGK